MQRLNISLDAVTLANCLICINKNNFRYLLFYIILLFISRKFWKITELYCFDSLMPFSSCCVNILNL